MDAGVGASERLSDDAVVASWDVVPAGVVAAGVVAAAGVAALALVASSIASTCGDCERGGSGCVVGHAIKCEKV